jgi:predicted small metal-binding protein
LKEVKIMDTTRYDFRLGFTTNRSELMKINVPHARSNATATEIADAMLDIINSDVVLASTGEPRFRASAELIRTDRSEFDI